MKSSDKKILISIFLIILIFLSYYQLAAGKRGISKKSELKFEIEKQQYLNSKLEADYSLKKNSNINKKQNLDIKEGTAKVLSDLKLYNLQLIDFSSSELELNLNLSGNFNSIIHFIYYLETEMPDWKINELKIKDSSEQLFFFIKLEIRAD